MKRWRLVFWPFFLIFAVSFGIFAWQRGMEQRCRRCIRLIGHPQADVAAQAWWDLRELYFTKWAAVNFLLPHLDLPDDRPISFLIEREKGASSAGPEEYGFTTRGRPVYYRTDKVWCRTVKEAILAFIYDERKWKVDLEENDWQKWWDENRGYYGRP